MESLPALNRYSTQFFADRHGTGEPNVRKHFKIWGHENNALDKLRKGGRWVISDFETAKAFDDYLSDIARPAMRNTEASEAQILARLDAIERRLSAIETVVIVRPPTPREAAQRAQRNEQARKMGERCKAQIEALQDSIKVAFAPIEIKRPKEET